MFSTFTESWDKLGRVLADASIPYFKNNHRPYLIRSSGLFIFLVVVILSQAIVNLQSHNDRILGYATNISTSDIVRLTNSERAKTGLAPLTENSALDKAAGSKANHMFAKDYWAHFAPDGTSPWYFFGLVGYKYTWAGENLARDFATSKGVVSAWMASNGHRANILNSNFTEIGIAVVDGNLEGEDTTLVVQLFGRPIVLASATAGKSQNAKGTKLQANLELPSSVQAEQSPGNNPGLNRAISAGKSSTALKITALVNGISNSQKITLAWLLFILVLLISDSVIIFRKQHFRLGSHSLAHASMIFLLIAATFFYGKGSIL